MRGVPGEGRVMGPEYRHPRDVIVGLKLPELVELAKAPTSALTITTEQRPKGPMGPAASDRVEAWMARKSRATTLDSIGERVEKAAKRGSRGTNVPLPELRRLLDFARMEQLA